jgi:hypothetical protein
MTGDYTCQHCGGQFPREGEMVHAPDCPFLVAKIAAIRYRKLVAWLLEVKSITFLPMSLSVGEPFAVGPFFYGPTFDDAVDSLPEVAP